VAFIGSGHAAQEFLSAPTTVDRRRAMEEGEVINAKLAMKHEGNTRLVELAMPWSEMPDVESRMDAGQNLPFCANRVRVM
jgi:hypothetical protein